MQGVLVRKLIRLFVKAGYFKKVSTPPYNTYHYTAQVLNPDEHRVPVLNAREYIEELRNEAFTEYNGINRYFNYLPATRIDWKVDQWN